MSKKLLKQLKSKFSIAASIGGSNAAKTAVKAKALGADLIELRIDDILKTVKDPNKINKIIKETKQKTKLPIIATIRSQAEQGPKNKTKTKTDRLEMFKSTIKLIDIIDIELSSKSINKDIIALAHKNNKLAIVSYHNFKTTPSQDILNNTAMKAKKLKADIIKITATANTIEDVRKLMLFSKSWKKTPIIAIAMGEVGTISRIVGFNFGSCITYGYVNKSFAPGQISVKELSVCSGIEL